MFIPVFVRKIIVISLVSLGQSVLVAELHCCIVRQVRVEDAIGGLWRGLGFGRRGW